MMFAMVRRQSMCAVIALSALSFCSPVVSAAQSGTWVEMAYCGAKPQKPPLEKLFFRVTFHNPTEELRWIVLPSTLYSAPTQQPAHPGVSAMELLANDNGTSVVKFFGSARPDPTGLTEGEDFRQYCSPRKRAGQSMLLLSIGGVPSDLWQLPPSSRAN